MAEERLFSLPNRREEGTKVVIVPVLIFPGNRTSSVSSVSTATRGGTYTRPEYRALCILCVADRVPGSGSPYRFNHDRMSRTLEGIWTTIGCWSHQTRGQRQKSHSAREGRWCKGLRDVEPPWNTIRRVSTGHHMLCAKAKNIYHLM
eukprot:3279893-Rhodomonas_salina.1